MHTDVKYILISLGHSRYLLPHANFNIYHTDWKNSAEILYSIIVISVHLGTHLGPKSHSLQNVIKNYNDTGIESWSNTVI